MTLTTPYSANFYVGNGTRKNFPYTFEEVSENFIKVLVSHADGTVSIPTYTPDLDQKEVIFGEETPAPTAEDVVCIYRATPTVQDTPFRTLEGYNAKALENILSKIVAMIQEIKSTYFSTQVLQGDPWQLDLLTSADDGATVNIDYTAKKLVKGLYFRIVDGNLQVSADDSAYITMPKSSDIAEFRQLQTVLPDLTVVYRLQYRIGNTWYDAEGNAESKADEAIAIAGEARATAIEARDVAYDAHRIASDANDKSDNALDCARQAQDAIASIACRKYTFITTEGQSSLVVGETLNISSVDLYWNGVLITPTGNWTVSNDTINLLFEPDEDDIIVVMVGTIRQVVNVSSLDAHNADPSAHAVLFNHIDCGVL